MRVPNVVRRNPRFNEYYETSEEEDLRVMQMLVSVIVVTGVLFLSLLLWSNF